MTLDLLTIYTNLFANRVVDSLLVIMDCGTMRFTDISPEIAFIFLSSQSDLKEMQKVH
jgi:hypothetical protein